MEIRLAESKDIEQLIKMRWDNTIEFDESKREESYEEFARECQSFLESALISNQWFIWLAVEKEKIVSHIYIELIQKVPRPGRVTHPFAYMTNVYSIPEYRNKGIGSSILQVINNWIKEKEFEFVIVWPSDEATHFYRKNGYHLCSEPMEFFPT